LYLLTVIIKKEIVYLRSIYTILHILSINIFNKAYINILLNLEQIQEYLLIAITRFFYSSF